MGGLPRVTVLRVADIDGDSVIAVPERWEAEGVPPPRLRVIERGRRSALAIGDRILARTEERGTGHVAHPMKKLAKGEELLLGVVAREGDRWWLKPVDKRERRETMISDLGEAGEGDLVLAEKTGRPPRITAKVTQVLGDPFAPRAFSLIAIHKYGIPHVFSEDLLEEADKSAGRALGEREDLRHLPIIAIDPVDARDFDDAVWASPRDGGGFDAIVAIADVSFYVRPGSQLDREARNAATVSISRTGSCRCCRRSFPPISARCGQVKIARRWRAIWSSMMTASDVMAFHPRYPGGSECAL